MLQFLLNCGSQVEYLPLSDKKQIIRDRLVLKFIKGKTNLILI